MDSTTHPSGLVELVAAARAHLKAAIELAPIISTPWPHCCVANVFPDEFYALIQQNLPTPDEMHTLSVKTTKRYVYWLEHKDGRRPIVTRFWEELRMELFDDLWIALENKLGLEGSSIGSEITHDVPRYSLGPHTDTPDKLITALFYLPRDNSMLQHGTVLYHSNVADPAGKGHKFGKPYKEVKTVPFAPNSMMFFRRTDLSFHGVNPTPVERWALAFDVFK